MKSLLKLAVLLLFACCQNLQAQVLFSNTFGSALAPCTVSNSSNGAWVWANSCTQSSAAGHSAPGHALFQGSSCQFGNGSIAVSGDLNTTAVLLPTNGGTLTFNYFIYNECLSGSCTYDVLRVQISTNGGGSFTDLLSSDTSPGGLANTSTWTPVSFNLSTYGGQSIIIRFNFDSGDGFDNAYDGIYVDDIIITGACPLSISAVGQGTANISVCSGSSITLTSSGVSNFTWSTGANTASIVVAPTTNTFYSLGATTSQNCAGTQTVNVTVVNSLPSLSIASGPNPICYGAATSFTASGALTYSWSGGVVNTQTFTPPSGQTTYTCFGINGCGTVSATRIVTSTPISVSALAMPTIVCQNYPATLTAVSSVGGFTWMPGPAIGFSVVVSTTANTIYTVTASDGTCTGTQTLALATKPSPTITAGPLTQVCQGTSVTLTAAGAGTGGTYSWSPIGATTDSVVISAQSSSVYVVYGTNNINCTSSAQQIIIVDMAPPITASANKTLVCTGGQVLLNASGAMTYSWTGGPQTQGYTVNPVSTTVYTVMGGHSTNSCVAASTITITTIIPNVSFTPSLSAVCSGSSTTLNASGATSYVLNGVPYGANGVFTVTPVNTSTYVLVSNTQSGTVNCPETYSAVVMVNPNPTVSVVASKNGTCKSQTNVLTASGATSYTWAHNSSTLNPIAVNPSVTTNYTVTGADANGCTAVHIIQAKVSTCSGIANNSQNNLQISIYPNPSNGTFNIKAESELTGSIVNEIGQIVATFNLNSANNYNHQVQNLKAGLYFMTAEGDGVRVTEKIIVAK